MSPGAGVTSTTLFNLEQNTDQLTLQSPPNNGVLTDVGALGLDISGSGGFDIGGGDNGLVLAARDTSANAALSVIGGAGGLANLIDIAIRL